MITVLVTGATGCLGREVTKYARRQFNVVALDHTSLDITNRAQVEAVFISNRINAVINCAGIVKGRCLISDSTMISVNSLGPHILAEVCKKHWARLIQVSTDCVFSGQSGPYDEDCIPQPIDMYGRSKLLGEVYEDPHLTVRTSFIGYGQRGLLNWLLTSRNNIPGYVDSIWNGLTAPVLARVLVELVKKQTIRGILHIGSDPISKYDLLRKCVEIFSLDVNVMPVGAPIEMRVNRTLLTNKDAKLLIPSMDIMLRELVRYRPFRYDKFSRDDVQSVSSVAQGGVCDSDLLQSINTFAHQ